MTVRISVYVLIAILLAGPLVFPCCSAAVFLGSAPTMSAPAAPSSSGADSDCCFSCICCHGALLSRPPVAFTALSIADVALPPAPALPESARPSVDLPPRF